MPWLLVIFFLFVLLAVGILLPYGLARRNSLRYAKAYDAFRSLDREFNRLKVEFERRNLEWMIGIRPVLYTEIDRQAQLCFARAYYFTQQGVELRNSLLNHLPEVSTSWQQIINLGRNFELLPKFGKGLKDLSAFSKLVGEIDEIRMELDNLPQQLTQKKETTESQLSRLIPEVGKAEIKFKQIVSQNRERVSEGTLWTVDSSRKALDFASSFISRTHRAGERANEFSYASAHIFVVSAYHFLELFWLCAEALIVPPHYQLDHFHQILDAVGEKLRQISTLNPPQDWNALYEAQSNLNSSSIKIKKARASLEDAHKKIRIVEEFELDLQKINLPGLLVEARDLQADCEKYWGSFSEAPRYWQMVLPEGRLPLERLESVKRDYYEPMIAPHQDLGGGDRNALKQTEIHNYLTSVETFLAEISKARQETQALYAELSRHKELQMEVLNRLSEEGDAYEIIHQLEEIKQNGSDEIVARYESLETQFHLFGQRAKKIQGANFPDLNSDLDQFVLECRQLKDQHERVIFEYQRLAQSTFDQLQVSYQEISTLQNEEPSMEWDWTPQLNEHTRLLDPAILEDRNYKRLTAFINSGETVFQNGNQAQERYQVEFSQFEGAYQEIFSNLQAIRDEVSKRAEDVNTGWGWRRAAMQDDMLRATNTVDEMRHAWEAAWGQPKVKDVLEKCAQIKADSDKILPDLDLRLQAIDQRQREFNNRYDMVEAALEAPDKFKLDKCKGGVELVNQLAKLIRENTDPEVVTWALVEAKRAINQAARDRLEQSTVFLLLTQIKSGQYKQSATNGSAERTTP